MDSQGRPIRTLVQLSTEPQQYCFPQAAVSSSSAESHRNMENPPHLLETATRVTTSSVQPNLTRSQDNATVLQAGDRQRAVRERIGPDPFQLVLQTQRRFGRLFQSLLISTPPQRATLVGLHFNRQVSLGSFYIPQNWQIRQPGLW